MVNNDDNRTLGAVIRDARTKAKLGLRELARELSITPPYQCDIEYDRRVPSEEVLRATADELKLDFDDLMARAGRFGDRADRYMKRNPLAAALFRTISEDNLSEEALIELQRKAEELARKKKKEIPSDELVAADNRLTTDLREWIESDMLIQRLTRLFNRRHVRGGEYASD